MHFHLPSKFLRRLLPALAAAAAAARAAPLPTEYQIKAVFIFHFTQFVEWPESAFPAPDAPFVIGVAGQGDSIAPALAAVVRDETVGRHPIVVRLVESAEAERRCQILYVPAGREDLFQAGRLDGSPVLTVGESREFLQQGGIVEFYLERRHVRLRIDLDQARLHSLAISAKLLRVADVVNAAPPPSSLFRRAIDAGLLLSSADLLLSDR